MDYTVDVGEALAREGVCLVLPMFATRRLGPTAAALDAASDGYVGAALERTGTSGHRGRALLLLDVPKARAERVLLIGCGRRDEVDARRFAKIAAHAAREMMHCGGGELLCALGEVAVRRRDLAWRLARLVEAIERQRSRADGGAGGGRSGQGKGRQSAPERVRFALGEDAVPDEARRAVVEARAIAAGVALARELADRPPNRCTPRLLAAEARALAERHPALATTVLDEREIGALGMEALLAVARGSAEPPRLIVVEHRGGEAGERPVCLVGKGVTFDSGGLSLKPAGAMEDMKLDMAGAAAVLGALECCARLALPLNVVGIVAAAENMPGSRAMRPGDVIGTLSGKTVEVRNTDAEGRLLLADALAYAARREPRAVIDVATLTGACVGALGRHLHGLFSNSRSLGEALLAAGRRAHDRAWQLPLLDDYADVLDSDVADMRNVGGRNAGAIVAACFLERFARELRWAHLDVAGTASLGGGRGASGRPVPLLARYLIDRAAARRS